MKRINLLKIMLTVAATASLATGEAMAGDHLYLVGGAAPAGWNEQLPDVMTAVGGNTFVWEGELAVGDFKFLLAPGTWNGSIVATQYNQEIADGQSFPINTSGNPDHKFYNPRKGQVQILVNFDKNNATFRRPAISLVGEAVKGWGNVEASIPLFRDNDGNIRWTGQLRPGEIKFLAEGGFDWFPCYNAPKTGLELNPGGHQLLYNNGQGGAEDYNYRIPSEGLYTLVFNLADGILTVSKEPEPDLRGGFTAARGNYLVGYNATDKRVHFGPVPQRLYIGTSSSDYHEIPSTGNGEFSGTVNLRTGQYYKLFSDPQNISSTAISPDRDTDITSPTANLSPMHGYSYTVPADGEYNLLASFAQTSPSLVATKNATVSGIDPEEWPPLVVYGRDGEIRVEGKWSSLAIYEAGGRQVGATSPCLLPPGFYLVIVDGSTYKIALK